MQVAVFGRSFPSYARENIATMFSKFSMLNVDVWIFEPLYEFLQKKTGLRPKVAGFFTDHQDLPGEVDFLFSLISFEGKRENLYQAIPKQDFSWIKAMIPSLRLAWSLLPEATADG